MKKIATEMYISIPFWSDFNADGLRWLGGVI